MPRFQVIHFAILVSVFWSLSTSGRQVQAQFTAPVPVGVELNFEGELPPEAIQAMQAQISGGPGAKGDNSGSKEDELTKAHNQKKLEAIKKLKFDRRASAVIKVWSTPEETEDAEKENGEDKPDNSPKAEEDKGEVADKPDSPRKPVKAERPKSPEQEKEAEKKAKQKRLNEEFAQFEKDLKKLQRNVTLGEWKEVKLFFVTLSEEENKALFKQLLSSLQNPERPRNLRFPQFAEKTVITIDDFFALTELMPQEQPEEKQKPEEDQNPHSMPQQQMMFDPFDPNGQPIPPPMPTGSGFLGQLTGIFRLSIQNGHSIKEYLTRFQEIVSQNEAHAKKEDSKEEPEKNSYKPLLTKRQIAKILANSNHARYLDEFLPTLEEAIEQDDREALNLLSRYYLSLPQKEKKNEHLEQAWKALQAVLSVGELSQKDKEEALKRAVELTPRVKEELGQAWLNESFSSRPERGKEILSSIGGAVAIGLHSQSRNSDFRLKGLELQKTAVDALLETAPEKAEEWRSTLQMMAANWLREAETSQQYDYSTQRGRMMQRDYYGNYYYSDYGFMQQQNRRNNQIQAIPTGKLLEIVPDEKWMAHIESSLHPKFSRVIAKLYLKVQEEDEAFPYIESLAESDPREAKSLAEEFLRIWTQNHNPNSERQRTNMYMFAWGFNQRAQGIPLTRSKQVRNLDELAEWLKRINALPIEKIDDKLISNAFTQVHSSAEVYQLEAIEKIFGEVDGLDPKTLSTLIQTMRTNLGSVWRMPATQKKAKTNRKQKDIEQEVLTGYATAQTVLKKAINKYPDSWSVQLAKASLEHDANEFQQELNRTTEFSERRHQSLAGFQKAAQLYAAEVVNLEEEKQETTVYETWFYASLGAPDLGKVSHESVADPKQFALIREAIQSLPGELAKSHLDKFANSLFVRMSAVNPGMKFSYLKGGFEIVGDHEQAREAKKVYDYYKDLVTEIKLETEIDGSDTVGHKEPFGLFVNIRHTKEIERESGGFTKYLQNQNRGGYWYYNYGRPLENYRDKFEEATTTALEEHFDILSITFQSEEVNSRATNEYGWRVTPYAYLLLKPKGAEVDKIPSLKLDMDFMDTSGYAVLPIESSPIPIDASDEIGTPRPVKNISVTQTLDERESEKGKLKLEVRATGVGLIPDLENIVDLKPEEFEITDVESEGVAVSQFDKEGLENAVISERTWMVSMEAKPGLEKHPESFTFGLPKDEESEMTYQRFVDADLASVEPEIKLEQEYGTPQNAWVMPVSILLGLIVLIVVAYKMTSKPSVAVATTGFQLPENITPFTALGVLRDIQQNNGLSPEGKEELGSSISRLEQYYFDKPEGEEPDLTQVLKRWVHKSS